MSDYYDDEDADYPYQEDDDGDYEYTEECDAPELKRESSYPDALRVPDGSYNVLEYADMIPLMEAMLSDIQSLLGVSLDVALILLSHYEWNKEKLLDAYWNDTDACLTAAGISPSGLISAEVVVTGPVTCSICYDEVPAADTIHLRCRHTFCRDCYAQYLKVKVESEGPISVKACCPEPKCKERIPDSLFKDLLDQPSLLKYKDFSVKNFIESSNFIRYCPAAGCDRVAIGRGITNVVCRCSNPFCFRCGEEAHDPATCSQLLKWLEKCRDESETANWMVVNTKKCPKCSARTEKNQGCNHMTCQACKHQYCWICMTPWSEHGQDTGGYYKCNRYIESEDDSSKSSGGRAAKVELERYLHYYTRYHGHHCSMRHAQHVQLAAVDTRIKALQEDSGHGSWVDIEFLRQAVLQVIECRRVLKYTYVLGYFSMSSMGQRELFEYHQEMLEKNTDILSEQTELPIESINRSQIVNLTRITEQFLRNLLTEMMDTREAVLSGSKVSDVITRMDKQEVKDCC